MRLGYLTLVGLIAIAGCGSEGGGTWGGASNATTARSDDPGLGTSDRTRLAAFAASSKYPDGQASDDMRITAVVDRRAGMIRILNPTSDAATNDSVWVNRNFVTRVDRIPAMGMVELDMDRFYNAQGQSLPDVNTTVREVQIQRGDKLHNLLGPVFE